MRTKERMEIIEKELTERENFPHVLNMIQRPGNIEPKQRTNMFGVVIHHTDTWDIETARRVLSRRKLSTHIMIDKDGTPYVEKPLGTMAAACIGFNKWMIQLDVVGRCEYEKPTLNQLYTLKNVLRWLADGRPIQTEEVDPEYVDMTSDEVRGFAECEYLPKLRNLPRDDEGFAILEACPFEIVMHGEVRKTKCPGKFLKWEVDRIRKELAAEA